MSHVGWIPIPLPATSGRVDSTPGDATTAEYTGIFGGITVRNMGVSAVQVDIYDNTSAASGTLLATIDLTAKGSVGACQTIEIDGRGVRFFKGVYASYSANTVQGSVYFA